MLLKSYTAEPYNTPALLELILLSAGSWKQVFVEHSLQWKSSWVTWGLFNVSSCRTMSWGYMLCTGRPRQWPLSQQVTGRWLQKPEDLDCGGEFYVVNLTGLRDAQIVGKTLCPGMSVNVLLDEISLWLGRLMMHDPPSPVWVSTSNALRAQREQKGGGRVNPCSLIHLRCLSSPALRHQNSRFSVFEFWDLQQQSVPWTKASL